MVPSELRAEARKALKENWGKGALITLAYLLINFLISFILSSCENNSLLYTLLSIAEIVVATPLAFGLTISFLRLKRNEETSSFGFLSDGFSRFSKSWGIAFQILIKMILPIVCIIFAILLMTLLTVLSAKNPVLSILGVALYIACIVYAISRGLLYSLAYYIAYDNPTLSSKECVAKSETFMTGNRGNLLLLELSFIGWAILGLFTLGIAYIWLVPYIQVAVACFYDKINTNQSKIDEVAEIQTEE